MQQSWKLLINYVLCFIMLLKSGTVSFNWSMLARGVFCGLALALDLPCSWRYIGYLALVLALPRCLLALGLTWELASKNSRYISWLTKLFFSPFLLFFSSMSYVCAFWSLASIIIHTCIILDMIGWRNWECDSGLKREDWVLSHKNAGTCK